MIYAAMIVLVLGLAFRIHDSSEDGIAPEREYQSALLARAFYEAASDDVPVWEERLSREVIERENFAEPPVIEAVAAMTYMVAGGESLWTARILSSVLWMAGGFFLFLIILRLASARPALIVTTYYAFLPTSILLGRSFQPDALTMFLFLASLYAVIRREESQSRQDLIAASLLSGITILIRPLTVFAFLSVELLLWLRRRGIRHMLASKSFWVSILILLGPLFIYLTVCVIWLEPEIAEQLRQYIAPQRLLSVEFWAEWLHAAASSVGAGALVIGVLGYSLIRQELAKTLVQGLGIGYVTLCVVFGSHVYLVGHYHLLLIVIVSLAGSALIETIAAGLEEHTPKWTYRITGIAALLILSLVGLLESRARISGDSVESQIVAREIGKHVRHSTRVAYVAEGGGVPLMYYSHTTGVSWPGISAADQSDQSMRNASEKWSELGIKPEFLVITDFESYRSHKKELDIFVDTYGRLVSETDHYLIYRISERDYWMSGLTR